MGDKIKVKLKMSYPAPLIYELVGSNADAMREAVDGADRRFAAPA